MSMHQEIRLHGHLDETIEYFAMAAARDAFSRYFFEETADALRFFSPGNEFVLHSDHISHRGNGGSICEYMFGVDQPLSDLAKTEVRNRLVLYGAYYGADDSHLQFTSKTAGQQSYEQLFFDGNATVNYFFFITGSVAGSLSEQQESLARLLGKTLKRSPDVGSGDDTRLLDEMYGLLGHRSSLYLIKLIHKKHKRYHDFFRDLYFAYKSIPDEEYGRLEDLAGQLGIDKYQQERIRVDVMYKHPNNQRIVDEYKNILIECNLKGSINQLENARLTRLKTLSVRNKIPSALFYALDSMLKDDKLVDLDEQDYLAEARQVLEGIFFTEAQIDASITPEDMCLLLHAKRRASENRDHTFEHILLETGKACDEKIHEGADISLLEHFSYIITYFDRYDNTAALINQLAFMENVYFGEEQIRSLLGNKKAFDDLDSQLWKELFFRQVYDNKYLGQFGRKKIVCLEKGMASIEDGSLTIKGLATRLNILDKEERLYGILLAHVKERIRNFYSKYNTRAEQEALLVEVADELYNKGLHTGDIPLGLFHNVVVNIKKEAIYLHNLLPKIIAEQDKGLREDFLENSGLDRFYVEELEREYFELNSLNLEHLYSIRKGLAD
ncbi:MAG: TIGR04442 family protein [Desulfuromonadales bacterium]|nr:TIGR04442 family protein [Desulfuromonadales bacterium]